MPQGIDLIFDMDGVLSVFDEQACIDKPFNRLRSHYFLTCEPDMTAIRLAHISGKLADCRARILTRIYLDTGNEALNMLLAQEHHDDKQAWCDTYLRPDLAATFSSIWQTPDKNCLLRNIPQEARRHMVLIDDDPRNLIPWTAAGGTGIQYIQKTRRVEPWTGFLIYQHDGPDRTVNKFREILRKIQT